MIIQNLRLLVDALEAEVYSDTESYLNRTPHAPLADYDEVFEDDDD